MSQPKSIETLYNGYRFRSRLEARWAVFFDALGIRYEYEKEGYDLSGTWYLPDFWLSDLECWVEIKGQPVTDEEITKASLLCLATRKRVHIFSGDAWFSTAEWTFIYNPHEGNVIPADLPSPLIGEDGFVTSSPYKWAWEPAPIWETDVDTGQPAIIDLPIKLAYGYQPMRLELQKYGVQFVEFDPRVATAYAAARSARF